MIRNDLTDEEIRELLFSIGYTLFERGKIKHTVEFILDGVVLGIEVQTYSIVPRTKKKKRS